MFGFDDIIHGLFQIGSAKIAASAAERNVADTNATNIQLARENRDYLTEMDNTAIQRRIKDLQEAGLNPMLAYTQGGADTPNSAAASVQSNPETYMEEGQRIGGAFSKMVGTALAKKEIEQKAAQVEQTKAETNLTNEQALNVHSQALINANMASAGNLDAASREANLRAEKLRHEIESIIQERKITELSADQLRKLNPLLVEAQKLTNQAFSLGIPEQKASAEWWSNIGQAGKAGPAINSLMQLLKTVRGH